MNNLLVHARSMSSSTTTTLWPNNFVSAYNARASHMIYDSDDAPPTRPNSSSPSFSASHPPLSASHSSPLAAAASPRRYRRADRRGDGPGEPAHRAAFYLLLLQPISR
jgi:hypothetical protein